MSPACSDAEFISLWKQYGSPSLVAKKLRVSERVVMSRRKRLESVYDIKLVTTNTRKARISELQIANEPPRMLVKHTEGRINLRVDSGKVIVFSDAHFFPGVRTTAFRALLGMIKQEKPTAIIANGDLFDGGVISRYPRIGWDKKPTVLEELKAVEERLSEIEAISGKAALIWSLGNHDARYETKLAAMAPEFEGINGFHLKDHFPYWKPCWTTWINDEVLMAHYHHSGMHAIWNNLLKNQTHMVTSHRHTPEVRGYTRANGTTIYGVDTGSLADSLDAHNVDYQRGLHGNHRSGFALLTFRDGQLLMPELVIKWDEDTVQFRGHLLDADSLELV